MHTLNDLIKGAVLWLFSQSIFDTNVLNLYGRTLLMHKLLSHHYKETKSNEF